MISSVPAGRDESSARFGEGVGGADEKQQRGAFHGAQNRPVRIAGQACGVWRDRQRPFDKLMVTKVGIEGDKPEYVVTAGSRE